MKTKYYGTEILRKSMNEKPFIDSVKINTPTRKFVEMEFNTGRTKLNTNHTKLKF